MLENLIETISKDILALKDLANPKELRKETSLLKARIESALKLSQDDQIKTDELNKLKAKLN